MRQLKPQIGQLLDELSIKSRGHLEDCTAPALLSAAASAVAEGYQTATMWLKEGSDDIGVVFAYRRDAGYALLGAWHLGQRTALIDGPDDRSLLTLMKRAREKEVARLASFAWFCMGLLGAFIVLIMGFVESMLTSDKYAVLPFALAAMLWICGSWWVTNRIAKKRFPQAWRKDDAGQEIEQLMSVA